MLKRTQGGYSLIEITLVLAISSGLIVIALAGFSSTRGQAQFSDSVERLTQQVLERRQEALSTVKLSGGTDSTKVTFGRLLTFTANSSTVQVQTLVTNNFALGGTAPPVGQPVTIAAAETTSFTIPWGVTYSGAQQAQVAFTRSTVDGALQTTAWMGTKPLVYGSFAPPVSPAATVQNINLVDPSGRQAHLVIDFTNNGVKRVYP
jgi:prepilin-type N-terminal cleavage/methylation domain-containing protein